MADMNRKLRIDVGGNGRIGPDKSSQPKTDFSSSQVRTGSDLRIGKPERALSKSGGRGGK